MAQIGLPQALGLGPGIALFPANFRSGFSSSLNPPSGSILDLSSTPVEEGSVLSGPPKGDICHRYGIEFMLLQRFYHNPELWTQLKTKYEERQKKRLMKRLKKKEALLLKEKTLAEGKHRHPPALPQQNQQQQQRPDVDGAVASTSRCAGAAAIATAGSSGTASSSSYPPPRLPSWNSKDGSSDENDEEEEKPSPSQFHSLHRHFGGSATMAGVGAGGSTSGHSFIILNARTGATQTVIQGPMTSKIQAAAAAANKDSSYHHHHHHHHHHHRLSTSSATNSPSKGGSSSSTTFYSDHPHVKSREELDLFHCLRDLDTTWSWILWSSKDHWNPEFLSFLLEEIEADRLGKPRGLNENIISSYLNRHQFTELYLDGINGGFSRTGSSNRHSSNIDNAAGAGFYGYHHNNNNNNNNYHQPRSFPQSYLGGNFSGGIPPEIFRCSNVRILSLRSNHLDVLPADIGRMQKLEYLALTNNRLVEWSYRAT